MATKNSTAKNSTASTAWKIFVGVFVTLLLLLLLAEFSLRWFMGHQMKSQFEESAKAEGVEVTEDPTVRFGGSPLIFGLLGGTIQQMDMTTPSTLQINGTEMKGQPATEIHVEDMTVAEDPVAGSLRASTTVPDDYLLATFQKGIAEKSGSTQVGNLVITAITANPEEDTLDVEFAGGLATLALHPEAKDGSLSIEATNASLLGFDLPEQATSAISDALQSGMSEQFVGGGMKVDSVKVEDGELKMTVTGQNIPLSTMNSATGTGASSQ